jgi:hypothetical protein
MIFAPGNPTPISAPLSARGPITDTPNSERFPRAQGASRVSLKNRAPSHVHRLAVTFTRFGSGRGHAERHEDEGDTPRDRAGRAQQQPAQVKRDGRPTCQTLHDTFASWLVQRGVSLFKVQTLPRAADPRTTQKHAKLAPGVVADEVAAVLDNIWSERAA